MIGSTRISAFVLSLMMATASMGSPVPGLPIIDDLLDCACDNDDTGTPSYPTPPETCGNMGLAYAIQEHEFENEDAPIYSNLGDLSYFHSATPIQHGITNFIGFSNPDPNTKYSIYGGESIETDYIAVNHFGYFVAPKAGQYNFSPYDVDDIVFFWFGDEASNGEYSRENAYAEQGNTGPSDVASVYSIDLEEGEWIKFRTLFVNGQSDMRLGLSVTDSEGHELMGSDTTESPYFAQYSCDGMYPEF